MGCCLKRLETSPFHWRWFCRCAINRLGHAFPQTRYIFTNGALIPTICLAWSFADAMLSSGNFFLLHVIRARAEHFQEKIWIFLSFVHVHRFQKRLQQVPAQKLKLFSEKIGKAVCVFSFMRESRTFEKLSEFPEHPIDFDDFLQQR